MKKIFQSYMAFTRTEKAGLAGLLLVIFGLIVLKIAMPALVQHEVAPAMENQILAQWKASQRTDTPQTPRPVADAHSKPTGLFSFDPNTLDSAGFRKLGLREKTTSILLNWRRMGKVFSRKEELREVYTLTNREYARLESYIDIKAPALKTININTADSATLTRIYGIGPKIAERILKYRQEHGPFTDHRQLMEVYHFQESVFERLKEELIIKEP